MKGTEAVWVVAAPFVFYLLGLMSLIPAIILAAGYIVVNLTGYSDKALWQTRDSIRNGAIDVYSDIKREVQDLKAEIIELKKKIEAKL